MGNAQNTACEDFSILCNLLDLRKNMHTIFEQNFLLQKENTESELHSLIFFLTIL